ncbi:hypothetical protein [Sanguibacter sp. Z1732]
MVTRTAFQNTGSANIRVKLSSPMNSAGDSRSQEVIDNHRPRSSGQK